MSNSIKKNNFSHWLHVLQNINLSENNIEIAREFFFKEFSRDPQLAYKFVMELKECLEKEKCPQMSGKYLKFLSSVLERMGFYKEKKALDNISFKVSEPKKYKEIEAQLTKYKRKSKRILDRIETKLSELIKENKFKCEVLGRYKTIYSIYRKISKKRTKNIEDLKDLFAFRVIIENNSIDECFAILNLLHDKFQPVARDFKDYINIPKINGYQSLHTGLKNITSNLDMTAEVQIRTRTMDQFAEKGFAAHWIYSANQKSQLLTDKESKILEHLSNVAADEKRNNNSIYFLSPQGDMFKMDNGDSVIDFAEEIHSELANKFSYAIVNGERQPANYKIQSGDIVEIVKSKA